MRPSLTLGYYSERRCGAVRPAVGSFRSHATYMSAFLHADGNAVRDMRLAPLRERGGVRGAALAWKYRRRAVCHRLPLVTRWAEGQAGETRMGVGARQDEVRVTSAPVARFLSRTL